MEGPLLVLSVCTAGLRRRRLRGLLPQLSWGKHRRRSRSCCLQTPGRAGCHQVDKVSHFARRQDYSQGQRLKWLLFELQSPKHSHAARRRERHTRSPPQPPAPSPMLIPFRIHCLHRDHSVEAAEHTRRRRAPCERQNARRYSTGCVAPHFCTQSACLKKRGANCAMIQRALRTRFTCIHFHATGCAAEAFAVIVVPKMKVNRGCKGEVLLSKRLRFWFGAEKEFT